MERGGEGRFLLFGGLAVPESPISQCVPNAPTRNDFYAEAHSDFYAKKA